MLLNNVLVKIVHCKVGGNVLVDVDVNAVFRCVILLHFVLYIERVQQQEPLDSVFSAMRETTQHVPVETVSHRL